MTRTIRTIGLLAVVAVLLSVCFPTVSSTGLELRSITGSGRMIDKTYDLSGFTSVEVSSGAQAQITRGDATSVKVTVDDNAADYLRVEKVGDRLVIGLQDGSYTNVTVKAAIVMPELKGVIANGGSRANFGRFETASDVTFNSTGGASITGEIDGGDAAVTASGGADVTVTGKGANLLLNHSGGGKVDLGGFTVTDAAVIVSGGSNSEIYATGKVTGSVTGGGQLKVDGPATVEVSASGGGQVLK